MTGNELKGLRKKHGLRLKDVGEALGVSWQAIQKKEGMGDEHLEWSKQYQIVALANLFNEPVSNFYPPQPATATADHGSVALVSGRDSSAVIEKEKNKYAPKTTLEGQLFSLILEVGTDAYKRGEVEKLLKVKELLGSGR